MNTAQASLQALASDPVASHRSFAFIVSFLFTTNVAEATYAATKFDAQGMNTVQYATPEPNVPSGVIPTAQCAFNSLTLNVSAIRVNYRS